MGLLQGDCVVLVSLSIRNNLEVNVLMLFNTLICIDGWVGIKVWSLGKDDDIMRSEKDWRMGFIIEIKKIEEIEYFGKGLDVNKRIGDKNEKRMKKEI